MTFLSCFLCPDERRWSGRFINDWSAFGAWLLHYAQKHGEG